MSNGKDEERDNLPTLPGPDIALRESDAEEMRRVLHGSTTLRSAAMAHHTAQRELRKQARKSGRR